MPHSVERLVVVQVNDLEIAVQIDQVVISYHKNKEILNILILKGGNIGSND